MMHTSRQGHCRDVCKISLWSAAYIFWAERYLTTSFFYDIWPIFHHITSVMKCIFRSSRAHTFKIKIFKFKVSSNFEAVFNERSIWWSHPDRVICWRTSIPWCCYCLDLNPTASFDNGVIRGVYTTHLCGFFSRGLDLQVWWTELVIYLFWLLSVWYTFLDPHSLSNSKTPVMCICQIMAFSMGVGTPIASSDIAIFLFWASGSYLYYF